MRNWLLISFLAFILLVVGCAKTSPESLVGGGTPVQQIGKQTTPIVTDSGNSVTTKGVKEFKVQAPHEGYTFYFEDRPVAKVSVNKGDKVRFLATSNLLSHNHGVTIDEYSINEVILTEDENNPKIIEFTADKTGTFKIYCKTCLTGTFGPHPWMEATLEVK